MLMEYARAFLISAKYSPERSRERSCAIRTSLFLPPTHQHNLAPNIHKTAIKHATTISKHPVKQHRGFLGHVSVGGFPFSVSNIKPFLCTFVFIVAKTSRKKGREND